MRSLLLALCLATGLSASPLVAQSKLDFTLLNRAGVVIAKLYVTPSRDDEWGEDILGRAVLAHSESTDILFSRSEKSCMWDMKIVDEDEDEIEWSNLDLCKASHITLLFEGGQPTAIVK